MKKWFLLLLILTACSKPALKPGPTDLESNNFQGKVRSVVSCINSERKSCYTLNFSPEGWIIEPKETLSVRTEGELKTYEYVFPPNRRVEKYQGNKKISETAYFTENDIESVSFEYTYKYRPDGKLVTEEGRFNFKTGVSLQTKEYIYTSSGELDRTINSISSPPVVTQDIYGMNGVVVKTIMEYGDEMEPMVIDYTYEFDAQKNWVKQFRNDELLTTRTITYY